MRFNAGHALNYFNVEPVAALPGVRELHIGHAIVSRAVFVGMREAVREMKALDGAARGTRACRRGAMIVRHRHRRASRSRASRGALERFGERFVQRILTPDERRALRAHAAEGELPRQALRGQGGVLQGDRHRHPRAVPLALRSPSDRDARGKPGLVPSADMARAPRRASASRPRTSRSPTTPAWPWRSSSWKARRNACDSDR